MNELEPQYLLHDWRKVYGCLVMFVIPVPSYGCLHREVPCWHLDYFVEEYDFVEVMGTAFGNLLQKSLLLWLVSLPMDAQIFILFALAVNVCAWQAANSMRR